jgi:single-strand DNA-binding protein
MGRLTFDPELKSTGSGIAVCSFTVAVDRRSKQEERQTDFIRCVAWRQTAEFISRYFHKGSMIAVQGSIQVRNYEDKNGQKQTMTEVIVDNASFCGGKNESGGGYRDDVPPPPPPPSYPGGGNALGGASGASQPAPSFATGGAADFEELQGEDDLPF